MSTNTILLDREDLIRALARLIVLLRERHVAAGIRIVGGAALALNYFDRRTTVDIDAGLQPESEIEVVAALVATEEGWGDDWLNAKAMQFLPAWGEGPDWRTLYDRDGIVVQVASPRALLAMKLKAGRPGRDVEDIRQLLSICEIGSIDDAELLFERLYPGEVVPDRTLRILGVIFDSGIPPKPAAPAPPSFDS